MEEYTECIRAATSIKELTKTSYCQRLTRLGRNFSLEDIFTSPRGIIRNALMWDVDLSHQDVTSILAVYKFHPSLRTTHQAAYEDWLHVLDRILVSRLSKGLPTVDDNQLEYEFYRAKEVVSDWLLSGDVMSTQQLLILLQVNMLMTCGSGMMNCAIMRNPYEMSDPSDIMTRWSLEYNSIENAVVLGEKKSFIVRMNGNMLMEIDDMTAGALKNSYLVHPRSNLFVDSTGKAYTKKHTYTTFCNRAMKKCLGEHMSMQFWGKIVKHKMCNLGT